ncbi:hypothetical protein [Flavobacterium gyeonganense]|uniref:hypothetical protein n=1 Tax=Flavobacterium gyeonganense TaxID=1310418 RepID=UPI002413F77F|nr:hypothetical protein [Flavobacterium gyeonganense]
MKRRYWVISPNVLNDGNTTHWLERSKSENKVFVGYDKDAIHGEKFKNKLSNGDCVIIAQGAKDNRNLFLAGLITSQRDYDEEGEVYFRNVDYYMDKNDFKDNNIRLNSNNAYKESNNPGTIYELKYENSFDKSVMDKINSLIKLKKEKKQCKTK